jgi:hypothetical protein
MIQFYFIPFFFFSFAHLLLCFSYRAALKRIAAEMFVHNNFFMYAGNGVYKMPEGTGVETYMDHAAVVYGFGVENGQPYWLAKNVFALFVPATPNCGSKMLLNSEASLIGLPSLIIPLNTAQSIRDNMRQLYL